MKKGECLKKFLVLLVFAVIFIGCSSKPSESFIKEEFVSHLQKSEIGSFIKVESFKKLNGMEKDDKTYTADVEYELSFTKSMEEISKELKQNSGKNLLKSAETGMVLMTLNMQYGNFKAGYKTKLTKQQLTFIKTENGWQLVENK